MDCQITPFDELSTSKHRDAADILMAALKHVPSAWHDQESAMGVVERCLNRPDRFALGAIAADTLVGWIGCIRHSEHNWEVHPLVVAPKSQRQGYGAQLIAALEAEARQAGICSLWLGTDDDFGGTNLFGADLYPDVLENLSRLEPMKGHPFAFYRKVGFSVVGVLPDASGPGSHDILMAKRIE